MGADRQLNVRHVPAEVHARLRVAAALRGVSMQDLLLEAVVKAAAQVEFPSPSTIATASPASTPTIPEGYRP